MANQYRREQEELFYRSYIADSLYALGRGRALERRFFDVWQDLHNTNKRPERSAEEIKSDIITRLNKEVTG